MRLAVTLVAALSAFGVPACRGNDAEPLPAPAAVPQKTSRATVDAHASKTRVVLLGTGTPIPDPDRMGPSTAIVAGDRAYLVDFGAGLVRRAAAAASMGLPELDPTRLGAAFATHLHSDHTAGLPDLLLNTAALGRRRLLTVFGPPGIRSMVEHTLLAYGEDLAVRDAERRRESLNGPIAEARELEPGPAFDDGTVKVTAFEVAHGAWPHAFGYRFDTADRSVVVSGDTGPTDAVAKACHGCDVLVHEVYCQAGFDRGPPSWQRYHATSHTSSRELAKTASSAKPKLLVLTHLLFFGCDADALLAEVRAGYLGDVRIGEDLDVF